MKYIISYDIEDDRVRRNVQKLIEGYARRIQKSVYIANITREELHLLKNNLTVCLAKTENTRLFIAPQCASCEATMFMIGQPLEQEQLCVVV